VQDNRERYREKFAAVVPMLRPVLDVYEPDAGFLPVGARARRR
jgi:N-succinyldiaminopimelate aminotransferase